MKVNFKRLTLSFLLLGISLPVGAQSLDKPKRGSIQNASQQKAKAESSDKESRDGEYWFSRGYELHQSGHYQEAINAFARSIDLGYRQPTAIYNIACGFALLNDTENALAWLDRAFAFGFNRNDLLSSDSDLDPLRSDPRFKQIIRKASFTNDEGKAAKERDGAKRDRTQEAISLFEQLRRDSSDNGNQWYKVGSRLLQLRDFDRATLALTQAVNHLGYRGESAMYNLACAYALKGDSGPALEWLERSINAGFDDSEKIQSDPDIASLRAEPRFKEIEKLSSTLSLSQFSGSFNGSNYSKQRWLPAIQLYESFLRGAPNNGRGWFNLGYALHFSSEHAKAVEAFKQAAQFGYRKPTSIYNIACAEAMMGHKDAAFEWLDKSVEAGFEIGGYIRDDDDLDNLRSDPRFKRFLALANDKDNHKEKHEK
jgi:Flp pilus assembly protein TadD